jgi:tRNA(fMet)-specific endonuclease VapC
MSTASTSPAPTSVVADTDVLSYIFKGDTRAAGFQSLLAGRSVAISFMTVAEMEFWAKERNWGHATRDRLERFLVGFAILYPDRALCELWGGVMATTRRAGRPIGPSDAWIAATALLFDVPLVTHNPADYAGVTGLQILSASGP